MPVPHHSVFYRPDALPATQPTASKHWRTLFQNESWIRIWCKWIWKSVGFQLCEKLSESNNIEIRTPLHPYSKCKLSVKSRHVLHGGLTARRDHWVACDQGMSVALRPAVKPCRSAVQSDHGRCSHARCTRDIAPSPAAASLDDSWRLCHWPAPAHVTSQHCKPWLHVQFIACNYCICNHV